jgi:hypothetical protein
VKTTKRTRSGKNTNSPLFLASHSSDCALLFFSQVVGSKTKKPPYWSNVITCVMSPSPRGAREPTIVPTIHTSYDKKINSVEDFVIYLCSCCFSSFISDYLFDFFLICFWFYMVLFSTIPKLFLLPSFLSNSRRFYVIKKRRENAINADGQKWSEKWSLRNTK